MLKASGDIAEIRAWANSPEGIAEIKRILQWARDKKRQLERSQRVSPDRMDRRMTR